jgi:hypothetical protein
MGDVPRTIVSVLRLRVPTTPAGHRSPVPIVHVDATMSDGSHAVLFSARVDEAGFTDSELIGLTAQQAYELAQERGIAL